MDNDPVDDLPPHLTHSQSLWIRGKQLKCKCKYIAARCEDIKWKMKQNQSKKGQKMV